jgi:UDP-N-acetylglucosamine--N-acetylmuramyl-(pentapeptide) pyrophosphoryl-undecaprenol N-acetylglucosamine transferase
MTIVVTGGGSGGHITPFLAVAHELKKQRKDINIVYIGQRGDKLVDMVRKDPNIDEIRLVQAGKFRRYHGEGLKQLLDFPTIFKNIRDAGRVLVGIWQCFRILQKMRPDVIFIKGGFVGVPVGLAAALLRIPYVTHDSDPLPGLANRIVAPWAKKNAVGFPADIYKYAVSKIVSVGIPVTRQYHPLTVAEIRKAKEDIGTNPDGKVLLITGGGGGARRLNNAIVTCAKPLLDRYPDLTIVHLTGQKLEHEVRQQYQKELTNEEHARILVRGFVTNLYAYSGAADVIVTRAGATSIAEFGAQKKACIVIPNPVLTGGHQLMNAKILAEHHAVKLVTEEKLRRDHHALMPVLVDLLDKPEAIVQFGEKLGELAQPDAAKRMAMVLLEVAQ